MDHSGGKIAAKRAKLSSSDADAGEDRVSALPDDVLTLILVRLDTAAEAARTSVLSRRWRRVWARLPELRFPVAPEPHVIAAVLAAHDAALRCLLVGTLDAAPESVAAWLRVAARRLSGRLIFKNRVPGRNAGEDGEEEAGERTAFELPCFERATKVSLNLGFLGLALPPASIFVRLTELSLRRVRFHRPCELGDAVSSQRCPSLQKLSVRNARGLVNLAIHSESLLQVELCYLNGLGQLNIDAPALKELRLLNCFVRNQPTVDISAPQLVVLKWIDSYPSSVQLGKMAQLQRLSTSFFLVYGYNDSATNRSILRLLERFQAIPCLSIPLVYRQDISNFQYLMGDITVLPHITSLTLMVDNEGHAFGASSFHVLRLCAGIRRLLLMLFAPTNSEAESSCPSGCICHQPTNWKTEELLLNHLEEVEITDLEGAEHEVAFVERLFSWATVLKRMKMTFDYPISESKATEFRQSVSSFCRPETRLEFYMYHDAGKKSWYLLAPEDQGTVV